MANGKKNKQNAGGRAAPSGNRNRAQANAVRRRRGPGTRALGKVRGRMASPLQMARRAFNAFHPGHLPLPAPQAPHLMVTTRTTFTTSGAYLLIGAMQQTVDSVVPDQRTAWSNSVALIDDADNSAMGNNQMTKYAVPMPTTDTDDFEMVPAAISFQVFGGDSLTDARGATFIGRCKNILQTPQRTDPITAYEYYQNLISFANPKAMSGAALAMHPQQVNLLPGHVSEVTDFESGEARPAYESFYWGTDSDSTTSTQPRFAFAGFKPGFIYNPSRRELQVTVAVQWRLRLAPTNPLHSSQAHYPPTPPSIWHEITRAAESMESGVEDVMEAGAIGAAGYLATNGAMEKGLEYVTGYAMRAAGAALSGLEWMAPLALA